MAARGAAASAPISGAVVWLHGFGDEPEAWAEAARTRIAGGDGANASKAYGSQMGAHCSSASQNQTYGITISRTGLCFWGFARSSAVTWRLFGFNSTCVLRMWLIEGSSEGTAITAVRPFEFRTLGV
eukprot:6478430-Amphidinium_carterae.1